jgi:RNA recognition motif-containing protein
VDFASKQEAKNAVEALRATHLYGRHLVIEWAKPDDTVDEIRARTAAAVDAMSSTKRRRGAADEADDDGDGDADDGGGRGKRGPRDVKRRRRAEDEDAEEEEGEDA